MKDEYDFKDAVRGKYAARFPEGPPTIHRIGASEDLRHEILKQYVADALAASQRAEFELFFLWSLEGFVERSDLGANRVRLLLEGQKESSAPSPLGAGGDGVPPGLQDAAKLAGSRMSRSFLRRRRCR